MYKVNINTDKARISYGKDGRYYVWIGVNEWNFVNIRSRTMMTQGTCKVWSEVERVIYGRSLSRAKIFPNYNTAAEIVKEIKSRKDEIKFDNNSIIGQILNKEHEREFDVDALKVYELVPTECKNM